MTTLLSCLAFASKSVDNMAGSSVSESLLCASSLVVSQSLIEVYAFSSADRSSCVYSNTCGVDEGFPADVVLLGASVSSSSSASGSLLPVTASAIEEVTEVADFEASSAADFAISAAFSIEPLTMPTIVFVWSSASLSSLICSGRLRASSMRFCTGSIRAFRSSSLALSVS